MHMEIGKFTEKHKILTPVIFWGFLILLTLFFINLRDTKPDFDTTNNVTTDGDKSDCLMEKMTLESLKQMASNEGIMVTQEDLDWVNQKPLCRDVCNDQKRYAIEYPNEWYANEDIRVICENIGLPLP